VVFALLAVLLTACPGGRVNHPPLAVDQSLETVEGTPTSITLAATDPDGDDLTYEIVADPEHGALTGAPPDLTYTPDAGYVGTDGFTFTASDGERTSNEATVAILVSRGNQAPVAQDQALTTPEDTALVITLGASDPDGDALTFAVVGAPAHGDLTGTAPDLTYTPDHDYTGGDALTFTASDGTLASEAATITIEVTGVNDPPVALDQTLATPEDTPIAITLAATDPDGDDLTYAVVDTPGHGTLTGAPPALSYLPTTDFVGRDAFTFTASDGVLTSGEATITIDVGGTNDAPTNLTLGNASIPENAYPGAQVGTFTTTDPDPADAHTYALVAGPGDDDNDDFYLADATLYTDATFDHEATPTKSVRVRTTDLQGAALEAAFTITVEDVNEPPTAIALTPSSIPENEPSGTVVGTLTTTDPDAGDAHTYSLTSGDGDNDNQRISVVGDELRSLEPFDHEVTSTLSVRVISQDTGGLGIEQPVTVTVDDVNEAPLVSITAPGGAESALPDDPIQLEASATDPEEGDISSRIEWHSDIEGYLGTDAALEVSLQAGMHEIRAMAMDTQGLGSTATTRVAVFTWITQLGTDDADYAEGIASDAAGNVYIAGATYGSFDGNARHYSAAIFLAKRDGAGDAVWLRQLSSEANAGPIGSSHDHANDVVADSNGNLYVTGWTSGNLDGNQNAGIVSSDLFLTKYDTAGDRLWTRQLGCETHDDGEAVAVDSTGNVFVVGTSDGDFDGHSSAGLLDAILAKFDSSGNMLWSRQIGSADSDLARGIAIDASDHVYIAGWTYGSLPGCTRSGRRDLFLIKYDVDGNHLWSRQFGGSMYGSTYAVDVAAAADGSVFVAGHTDEPQLIPEATRGGAVLVKYHADGAREWVDVFDEGPATSAEDQAVAVASTANGAFSTGRTDRTSSEWDLFIARYTSEGTLTWLHPLDLGRLTAGSPSEDEVTCLSSLPGGGLVLAGTIRTDLTGDATDLDVFILRFDP
jgi:hypothetical protein